ncbi:MULTISPECIES: DNA repair protein RecO [unclassified Acinetobacter]|uniref:DNA repair protein RecO n=1 Tax=unclassified Acinetobacter TaxID=196816 RepID=UPI0029344B50|nr:MULTISPECIES: DNA repair protein RecO [unclassified Acinetobacter]WOE31632.1 DNA repair protein RecO [Acinetobacter sp. SAAs470]WOE37097.1 DNA repair protein RecO [Acinetobacter sp. SAAs474]
MRNQILQGYLIHHRKYRERSHIVHLFTQEYGRIDGILRQTPPPQYQLIRVQVTGKSELKNFSHLEMLQQPVFFFGNAFFSGFYLNELLLRLCPLEVEMPATFQQYMQTIQQLSQLQLSASHLRQILRQFEYELLAELGYALDFSCDSNQQPIAVDQSYVFQLNDGFILTSAPTQASLQGCQILQMNDYEKGREFSLEQLQLLSKLYRQMITALLGDRPLKSRQLWIQNTQIQPD